MKILKWLKNLLKKSNNIDTAKIGKNILLMDAGASKWKAELNGVREKGKSSIIEITKEEVGTRGNVFEVNGKYYSVGDRNVNCSMEILKHKKDNIEYIILYSLAKLHDKVNDLQKENGIYYIDMFLLLPFNQLTYFNEWERKFKGKIFSVTPNMGKERKYKITLRKVLPEGGMSRFYINEKLLKGKEDVIISDWGHSSIDNVAFWTGDQEMGKGIPCNRAIRDLLVQHNFHIKRKSPDILGALYGSGKYKVPKEYVAAIKEENRKFIESVIEEMELSILGEANEYDTSIVFVGGGANMLHNDLIEFFQGNPRYKEYNLIFLDEEESVFSNIMGMGKYVEKYFLNKETPQKEIESSIEYNEGIPIEENEIKSITEEILIEKNEGPITEKYEEIIEEIGNGGEKGKNIKPERKKEIVEYLKKIGKTGKEISLIFQVDPKTIRNWCKQ